MSGWGGFWIAVAIVLVAGLGWTSRVDCGWLRLTNACNYVNANYLPKAHSPDR